MHKALRIWCPITPRSPHILCHILKHMVPLQFTPLWSELHYHHLLTTGSHVGSGDSSVQNSSYACSFEGVSHWKVQTKGQLVAQCTEKIITSNAHFTKIM